MHDELPFELYKLSGIRRAWEDDAELSIDTHLRGAYTAVCTKTLAVSTRSFLVSF